MTPDPTTSERARIFAALTTDLCAACERLGIAYTWEPSAKARPA